LYIDHCQWQCTRAAGTGGELCDRRSAPTMAQFIHRSVLKLLSVSSLVILTAMTALFIGLGHEHAQTPLPERIATVEQKNLSLQAQIDRLIEENDTIKKDIEAARDRSSDLEGQISMLRGIGIGLGAVVMVLQVFGMLLGLYGVKKGPG
jgi:Flp pilus assembly protein TadB